MSSRRERIDALLEHFGKELADLRAEAMAEIRQGEREAYARMHRYYEATEELGEVEAEIANFKAERENIPDRAQRAGMDERYEEEDRLRECFKNLGRALEALEARRGSLKKEVAELLPRPTGHDLDATIQALSGATGVAHAPSKDFEYLLKGLADQLAPSEDEVALSLTMNAALEEVAKAPLSPKVRLRQILAAADPVVREHKTRYAEVEDLSRQRQGLLAYRPPLPQVS